MDCSPTGCYQGLRNYRKFVSPTVKREDAKAYMYSFSRNRRVHKWTDIQGNLSKPYSPVLRNRGIFFIPGRKICRRKTNVRRKRTKKGNTAGFGRFDKKIIFTEKILYFLHKKLDIRKDI